MSGAVVVSTPQNISLIDVKRAIDMFKRVNVKILGLIENMAYMVNPTNGEKIQMFPKGELGGYLDSEKIEKIGEIPFNPSIGIACEAGSQSSIATNPQPRRLSFEDCRFIASSPPD
ncbi:MAG: P-loop NTPase [Bdellovibrionales bacterium]|nr:P-loop NTPase [Bdellovibrionales bacterium]